MEPDSSDLSDVTSENFRAESDSSELKERAERLRLAVRQAGGNNAVAARAGVPVATLNGHISGRDMKSATLVALADACGVHIAWLAAGRGPMLIPTFPGMVAVQAAQAARAALGLPEPSASPPPPAPEPSKSGVFSAMVTMDAELLGKAINEAATKFAEAGRQTNATQLATVTLALYDNMSGQLTKP